MSLGFVLLVHDPLDRAAEVARHLAQVGAPVVIHVDARVPRRAFEAFRLKLADLASVHLAPRRACHWGTWSIVAATRDACRLLLAEFPDAGHVFLACGTALPLRPIAELRAFLAARPDTDFIESVTTEDVAWTVGGLDRERFTLSFPFAWKSQRGLFDLWVKVQRRLGLRRAIPDGIAPHLGSQWWCLTRETLERIFADSDDPRLVRYFSRVWIPDESYFQTVVRRHARQIESRSLTLSRFDVQGRPHVFYDDHLDLLAGSDRFMARKVWPRADALYRHFLSPDLAAAPVVPDPARVERVFARALERRTRGRPGLYMQSRFPKGGWENGKSAAPYFVYEGFADLVEDWTGWLGQLPNLRVHGHLYAPDRAEFAEDQTEFAGALSDIATLRDYNPVAFLTNLVWNTRGERQCFSFGPEDHQAVMGFVASDPNASVSIVSGAWMVRLLRANFAPRDLRRRAAALQTVEAAHLDALGAAQTKARVRIWTLAEFLDAPEEALRIVLDDLGADAAPPRLRDLGDLAGLVRALRDEGMPAHVAGDIARLAEPAPRRASRVLH